MHLSRRQRPRRHRGGRGQALVEMALVAPILIVMLMAGAQVGEIAYGEVSVDTAAREGARAGAFAPNPALASAGSPWYSGGNTSHQCTTADFTAGTTGNPVCIAVLNSRGLLDSSLFTTNPCGNASQACVTITVIGGTGGCPGGQCLRNVEVGPPMAHLASSSCNNSQATITGTVSGIPSGSTAGITATTGETQPTGQAGGFTICVRANGSISTQTLTAQSGTVSCGGYSGSIGPFSVSGGGTYTEGITVIAEPACPTPTPAPTTTPTPTPGPTPPPGSTATPVPGPSVTCAGQTVPDGDYLQVVVTYPIPIFVPIVGSMFQSQPGLRQVTATVTYAIDPCTMT
jgi:Flp pilus assembly protein TadG